jgi:hypothetical protein
MGKLQVQNDLCQRILELDKTIRFVGLSDRFGKTVSAEYRKGSTPLLSKDEESLSIIQGAIRMGSRKTMLPKLGRLLYTFSVYEKVKRATIPLGGNYILMVSFDIGSEHDSIISKKILPLVKEYS